MKLPRLRPTRPDPKFKNIVWKPACKGRTRVMLLGPEAAKAIRERHKHHD